MITTSTATTTRATRNNVPLVSQARVTRTRVVEGPYAKALRMRQEGYTLSPVLDGEGRIIPFCYRVTRPALVQDVTGDTVDSYYVNVHPLTESCDCPFSGVHGERHRCKHLWFCRLMVAEAALLLSPCVDLRDVLEEIGLETEENRNQ